MTITITIYIISNRDLGKHTFDITTIVLNSKTFNTEAKQTTVVSMLYIIIEYIRLRDISVIFKWFSFYFGETTILL
jgi:hypothetical protein